jgi:hypothetical protein
MAKEFRYEIKAHFGTIAGVKGYKPLELNAVSFNDAAPRYDLRHWVNKDGKKMGKGIVLSGEQIRAVRDLLNSLPLEDL